MPHYLYSAPTYRLRGPQQQKIVESNMASGSNPNPSSTNANITGSSNNWRNPTEAQMQKYSLNPLPENFEPTAQEQLLLDTYDVIRTQERHAKRLKEEAARKKLEAAKAQFEQQQQQNQPHKKKHKRKRDKTTADAGNSQVAYSDDDDDDDDSDSDLDDDEDEEPTLHDRREAKLEQLRRENEAKAQALQDQQEEETRLREELLGEGRGAGDAMMGGADHDNLVVLKKQRVEGDTDAPQSSLIQNITHSATPPHDFSKQLQLTRVHGTVLFPAPTAAETHEFKWEPPEGVFAPNDGAFVVSLPDFDVSRAETGQGNNTLAIKFTAPADSRRFSINIAAPDHDDFESVLFHFNPRQRERGGQLVVNNKQDGTWGQAIAIPLSQVPLMFGQPACTLLIQINGEGFDIFVENQHCARLEHRKELPAGNTDLVLQFPSTDDRGSPEHWTVYKVWWGNKPILAKGDVSGIPGVNNYDSVHPRKLFISSLGKIFTAQEVDIRRAELERAFRAYGGDQGVSVIVPTNTTYAFVECESERQADRALQEMAEQYRMNRARRSRHDALLEARAAREQGAAAGGAAVKEAASAWD